MALRHRSVGGLTVHSGELSLYVISAGADCVNAVKEASSQLDTWLGNQNTWKMAEEVFG